MKLPTTGVAFMLVLGAMAALPPIAIDMALPALTSIGRSLHATADQAGLTLSLFMAGFAISPVIYGPLADRFGRRPLLLVGLVLFTAGGIAASLAPSIALLLAARLVQGAGAGAGMTLALVIVRDLFEGRAAHTRLAVITIVANVAPIVAPALGAGLMDWTGWRGIYGVMAAAGSLLGLTVWFGLGETQARQPKRTGRMLPRLIGDYRSVLTHHGAMAHILINALGFSWMFAYVAGSPLVLLGTMHVSQAAYAGVFACTGAGIVAGASINGRLAKHGVPSERLLLIAIVLAVLVTAALVAVTKMARPELAVLVPLLVLATGCFGLAAPSAAHKALEPIPAQAGVAGGLLTAVQMAFGALASSVVALMFPRIGALAMTGTMAACAIAASLVFVSLILSRRGSSRRFRKLLPAVHEQAVATSPACSGTRARADRRCK